MQIKDMKRISGSRDVLPFRVQAGESVKLCVYILKEDSEPCISALVFLFQPIS